MYIIFNSFSKANEETVENVAGRRILETLLFSLLTNSENFWDTDIKSIRSTLQNLKYNGSPFQLAPIIGE
jgi:hypothetical protein